MCFYMSIPLEIVLNIPTPSSLNSLLALKIWLGNLHGHFFRQTFRLVLTTRFQINVVAAITVFFFSLQPTCIDLSYLKCLSMLDSHKAVSEFPKKLQLPARQVKNAFDQPNHKIQYPRAIARTLLCILSLHAVYYNLSRI